MHSFRSLLFSFLCVATLARAQTPPAPAGDAAAPAAPRFPRQVRRLRKTRPRPRGHRPSLGATSYEINASQIAALAQGADASFNQVLLRVPGVAQDSFGQVHVRGEHANLQYRINDVLLPEGISGFGQELDTRFVDTLSVLTGSLPAQYGYRTSGIVDIHTKSGTIAKADAGLGLWRQPRHGAPQRRTRRHRWQFDVLRECQP